VAHNKVTHKIQVSNELLLQMQQQSFAGYDPFDFLNCALLQKTGLDRYELVRLAWLQFGKLSPINFRSIVGVPRLRNPKGIGLFILGMMEDFDRTGDDQYLKEAIVLADWLLQQQCDKTTWQYPCWGYHFDWQARAFFVPKGTPNIITTCYVARALHRIGTIVESEEYIEAALGAAKFVHKHLLLETNEKTFFAYIPKETAFIHNASLWGAAWVAQAGAELGNTKLQETALIVARESANRQLGNGAWTYGDRHHHQFIDGFHTGYNLEALKIVSTALDTKEFDSSVTLGMNYYRSTFFLEDGTAKYFNDSVYPLDMHSFSQGVLTLLKVSNSPADAVLANKIMESALQKMYLQKEKRFAYQKHRWFTNKINYIRWTQAWAYYGLAFFNRYQAEGTNEPH
jgi:hypothetical protein